MLPRPIRCIQANKSTIGTHDEKMNLLTQIVFAQSRSLRVFTSMLMTPEIINLAQASTEIIMRLMLCADNLYIRNVVGVPDESLHRASRPVVAFFAPWPGTKAFEVA